MDLYHALLLGLVQGLGEFLPISSSAHLVVLPWLMNFPTPGLTFDVALHFGTLISLLIYFYRDWLKLGRAFFTSLRKRPAEYSFEERLIWYLILGTIPAMFAGLFVEDYAETLFRSPLLVATMMAVFGTLLYITDRYSTKCKNIEQIGLREALLIGLAQCLALIPGSSRSGVTITAGLALGMDRFSAARFSFLLSTPIVAGAALLKAKDMLGHGIDRTWMAGIAFSALVGFLAIKYMLHFLKTSSYAVYVLYRWGFALVVFAAYIF